MRIDIARSILLRLVPGLLAAATLPFALALGAAPAPAMGAPQPQLIPTRWQLDIEPGPLRIAEVSVQTQIPGPNGSVVTVEQPQLFYYLTYTVTNNSGEDLMFAPAFELATDSGELIRSGRGVPAKVTRTIMRRLRNPFLHDQISVIGNLGQGPENARDGVVIWPAEDLRVDEVTIFARGFSGESHRVTRPDTGEEIVLRKVLMLRHETPGTIVNYGDDPIERVERRWILR